MSGPAIIAKITAAPGKRAELIAALQGALANAETEPGTLVYLLHEDTADENGVWFYERYADDAALAAHGSSEFMKSFGKSLAGLTEGRPQLTFLRTVGGKGA
jgi:quinol monooxygenase YgiN